MLLADLADTSRAVGDATARNEKVALIAAAIADLPDPELRPGVSYLGGVIPQGSIGLGWKSLESLPEPATQPSVTVGDLDGWIAEVASLRGPGSQAARRNSVDRWFTRLTGPEQHFVRGLLLGNLRQGALEGVVAAAIAKASGQTGRSVRRAFMLSGDLGATAVAARAGRLAEIHLEVGRGVLPMLAKSAESIESGLESFGTAQIEWKLDGARVQVHHDPDATVAFTRNLNPTPAPSLAGFQAEACILDGETIAIGADGRPRLFQDTIGAFAREDPGLLLSTYYFDILHLDGDDLLDRPLSDRMAVLDRVVPGEFRIPRLITADVGEAAGFLAAAVAAGHEGVMVKDPASAYDAGRRGAGWLKVKPVHTLDLVVLAVEWGSGRRQGWLSNIHLGARAGNQFVMLGKTFKGMTDDMLAWQTQRFLELETHREGHIVHVRPEQVVEIALDGVQRSTRYPGGVALRFARVRRYRHDKSADRADTLSTVRALLGS